MRKVIVPLDGAMENLPSWTFQFGSKEQEMFKSAEIAVSDAFLLGQTTYGEITAAWTNRGTFIQ